MKKIFTILSISFAAVINVFGQNYYYVKKIGENPTGYDYVIPYQTSNSGTPILDKPNNDALSPSQTIPFTFNFYGEAKTNYKACDNGYITFNTAATSAVAPSNTLSGTDPNDAIYAFWHDFELKAAPNTAFPTRIVTYNTGTAPNRRHVIQWAGVSRKGEAIAANSNVYAFAIVLYEGTSGRFDIVYNAYGSNAPSAIIGTENSDGSLSKTIGNSTSNFPIATGFSNAENVVYQFNYGTQPALDPTLLSLGMPKYITKGTPLSITGKIANYGSTTINSLDIKYSVDNGAEQSYTINSANLLGSGETVSSFTHNIPWTASVAGVNHSIKVWVANPNGGVDDVMTNNELTTTVLRNNGTLTAQRNVLFEEASGAWCGYCPDGHLILKDMLEQYGEERVIAAVHHNADAMTTAASDEVNATYAGGYPDGYIDRTVFPANRGTWNSEVASRLQVNAPVTVTIDFKAFNPTSRAIQFRVKAKFTDFWAGDLRLGAIVTESNVRGPNNNQWSQVNFYSSAHSSGGVGGSSHPLYGQKASMEGYYHNHVTRSMPGGAWGITGVIPSVADPAEDYTYDFTYTLPALTTVNYTTSNNTDYCSTNSTPGNNYGWNKPADINLIGYVAEYDGNVTTNRPILNAGSDKLWDLAASIQEALNNVSIESVYPNPATNSAFVKINLTNASNVKVTLLNSLGQVVSLEQDGMMDAGDNILNINTSELATGVYTVNIVTENGNTSSKLTVVR